MRRRISPDERPSSLGGGEAELIAALVIEHERLLHDTAIKEVVRTRKTTLESAAAQTSTTEFEGLAECLEQLERARRFGGPVSAEYSRFSEQDTDSELREGTTYVFAGERIGRFEIL